MKGMPDADEDEAVQQDEGFEKVVGSFFQALDWSKRNWIVVIFGPFAGLDEWRKEHFPEGYVFLNYREVMARLIGLSWVNDGVLPDVAVDVGKAILEKAFVSRAPLLIELPDCTLEELGRILRVYGEEGYVNQPERSQEGYSVSGDVSSRSPAAQLDIEFLLECFENWRFRGFPRGARHIRFRNTPDKDMFAYGRRIYDRIGAYVGKSFEEWMDGFCMDRDPMKEIEIFERFADVHEVFVSRNPLSLDARQKAFLCLVLISLGWGDDEGHLVEKTGLTKDQVKELLCLYAESSPVTRGWQ